MVYKYQIETLEHLNETRKRLEKLTDSRMSIRIGTIRDDLSGTSYYEEVRDLYFCINHKDGILVTTFKSVGEFSLFLHDVW